jgi:hypothetical protein
MFELLGYVLREHEDCRRGITCNNIEGETDPYLGKFGTGSVLFLALKDYLLLKTEVIHLNFTSIRTTDQYCGAYIYVEEVRRSSCTQSIFRA